MAGKARSGAEEAGAGAAEGVGGSVGAEGVAQAGAEPGAAEGAGDGRSVEERLSAVESALAALVAAERKVAAPTPRPEHGGAAPPDLFWALEGLREREPAPGAVMIVGDVALPDGRTAGWQLGAGTADLLDDEWESLAEAFAALGHPVRLRLVREVLRGHGTARELADLDGMGTTGQVYHHLRQLASAGWLRAREGGRHEVPAERVVPLLTTILGGRR
ncbi:winged helix-turn-helix domain-containing protein [Actinocorallia sp. A-T 12471]|uniref:ArsR/SmtB family transcription factor n=1 Tax=Actinocorallia sp. A-T 12471 TaxID=3089813 RepID=UPI0029CD2703|nr:winged helix-turn-helix domain-containing protein [Actinocorallia sp. A-T 12471]MDX6739474.1 winged helix-turn-helix domain-containing protein [Actinocorallia sp. A-T 12471]